MLVRKLDDIGRLQIPKEIRKQLGIVEGEPVEISVDGDKIIYRKHNTYDNLGALFTNFSQMLMDLNPDLFILLENDIDKIRTSLLNEKNRCKT